MATNVHRRAPDFISVEEYFALDNGSNERFEYLEGRVYRLPDERVEHHRIAENLFQALSQRLDPNRWQAVQRGRRLTLLFPKSARFYVPDGMVVPISSTNNQADYDEPILVAEVSSRRTKRCDENEKLVAYRAYGWLAMYLIINQAKPEIVAYRRSGARFKAEVYSGLESEIYLPKMEMNLPLREIYQAVRFSPEHDPDPNQ